MIRVCSKCKGSGLARYHLPDSGVSWPTRWGVVTQGRYAGQTYLIGGRDGRLCRTCHGQGVEGLEEVERYKIAAGELIALLAESARQNDALRAELRDLAERAGELEECLLGLDDNQCCYYGITPDGPWDRPWHEEPGE